jgi:hypothetical protein
MAGNRDPEKESLFPNPIVNENGQILGYKDMRGAELLASRCFSHRIHSH